MPEPVRGCVDVCAYARVPICVCVSGTASLLNEVLYLFAQSHTDKLNTQVALHQLYQYASKYYDGVSYTQVLYKAAFFFLKKKQEINHNRAYIKKNHGWDQLVTTQKFILFCMSRSVLFL